MGDYCYMQITCAAADAPRFKSLDFEVIEREGALITLESCDARKAEDGVLPRDIVYEGYHDFGDDYEGAQFASDGQEFATMPSGMDDGVIVMLRDDGVVAEKDLNRWLKLVEVRKRALALLEPLRQQLPPEPIPLDLDRLLLRAGEAAACDQWLAEKLHQAAEAWVSDLTRELPRDLTDQEREELMAAYKDGYFEPPASTPSLTPTSDEEPSAND